MEDNLIDLGVGFLVGLPMTYSAIFYLLTGNRIGGIFYLIVSDVIASFLYVGIKYLIIFMVKKTKLETYTVAQVKTTLLFFTLGYALSCMSSAVYLTIRLRNSGWLL